MTREDKLSKIFRHPIPAAFHAPRIERLYLRRVQSSEEYFS